METAHVEVTRRETNGKGGARKLRQTGKLPGIFYGEGEKPQAILLDAVHFETLRRAGAHHRLLEVRWHGESKSEKALVREMQVHPVSRAVLHVDLQRVSMAKRVRMTVPVVLLGKPEGVKTQGGILEHHLREVEVECLPGDIPDEITLEVGHLQIGQAIHVSDLQRPGVQFTSHPETTVVTVSLPAAERAAEEVSPEAAALAAAEPGAEGEKEGEKKEGEKKEGKEKEGKEKSGKEKGSS
ncbi:MAG TPA: 50S ribosomal protein L25 [Candidatus Krumholzibacteria bacterium]|nr:50S ribosomal protein L25 [Candidatus Krumholzibacteria bacterium]